jgi:hypothetical protein
MQLLLKCRGMLAALSFGLLALWLAAPAPSQAASCTPGWRVVQTPASSSLHKVSALSGNAWVIGERLRADDTGATDPLIMRFDGSRWTEVPMPALAELAAVDPLVASLREVRKIELQGVFARTASDAWVVGTATGVNPESIDDDVLPITMHWDGSAWRFVPAATPASGDWNGSEQLSLRDVVAFGPDDAWAVGYWNAGGNEGMQPIAMHWDGSRWTLDSRVHVLPGLGSDILSAAARTPYSNTLWTVGHAMASRYQSGNWTHTALPTNLGIADVAAVAWNDVWAVGAGGALHRDGSRWSAVPTPGAGALTAVSAAASNDVWAIGRSLSGRALMLHWDGTSWATVTPPAGIGRLADVAMRPSGWGWAVGGSAILRHCP